MNDMRSMTPEELKQRLMNGESLQIIDVREDEEVAQGMIPGAKHIPLGQLPFRLGEIDDAEETILVCRSGNRSSRAYDYLQVQGYNGLVNLTGGMMAWERQE